MFAQLRHRGQRTQARRGRRGTRCARWPPPQPRVALARKGTHEYESHCAAARAHRAAATRRVALRMLGGTVESKRQHLMTEPHTRLAALAAHLRPLHATSCGDLRRYLATAGATGPNPLLSPRLVAHQATIPKLPVPALDQARPARVA